MKSPTRTRLIGCWAGAFFALTLAGLLVALVRAPSEIVCFEIVDYVTGKPVQGATIKVCRTWTSLPVEKLPFLGLKSSSIKVFLAPTNVVQRADIPKFGVTWIAVAANGYGNASIMHISELDIPDVYRITYSRGGTNWLHESCYEYVNKKKTFTVALEPAAGGIQRAGAHYLSSPSAGSREKAIGNAKREAEKWDWKQTKVDFARFVNGHWEIQLSRVPKNWDEDAQFDVADDGKLLGIHTSP